MRLFLINILLSMVWIILTGKFNVTNFFFGFIISYFILWLVLRRQTSSKYFKKIFKTIHFFVYFFYQIVKANVRVAYDILTVKHYMRPGILAVPLDAKTNLEITLLSNIITLTPGTLSLDVSTDRKVLYIHFMYIDNIEDEIKEIKDFERRLTELLR